MRYWLFLTVCGLAACDFAGAQTTQPTKSQWFVYNATLKGIPGAARKDNGFNANCQGWSWQQAGFLDANGKPYAINATTHNIMNGDAVVGTYVEDGIYRSEVGNAMIADLSGGATLQRIYDSMMPFPDNAMGRLHLSVHGGLRKDPDTGAMVTGGLIILDNNSTYAGFRTNTSTAKGGTGVPGNFPIYTINAQPQTLGAAGGGRFNLELYSCNTGQVPPGGVLSVAQSAPNSFGRVNLTPGGLVQRVNTVTSSVPEVKCVALVDALNLPAGVTPQMITNAITVVMKTTPADFNACRTVGDWLNSLPFLDHYNKLSTKFATLTVPRNPATGWAGGNVTPTWKIDYRQITALNFGPGDVATDEPAFWSQSTGGQVTVTYTAPEDSPNASVSVTNIIGGRPEGTNLHLCAAGDIDFSMATPPAGLELATSAMRLSPYDDEFTAISGRASLQYNEDYDPASLELYRLIGNSWIPFSQSGNPSIDLATRTFSADFNFTGAFNEIDGVVVAGFAAPVPEPMAGMLTGAMLLGLLSRRARDRARRST